MMEAIYSVAMLLDFWPFLLLLYAAWGLYDRIGQARYDRRQAL